MEINKEEFYKQKEKAQKEIDKIYEKAEEMQKQFNIQYKDDICDICHTWTTSIIRYPYMVKLESDSIENIMTKRLCKKCFVELMSLKEKYEKEYEREHNKLLEKLNRKYKKIDIFLEE